MDIKENIKTLFREIEVYRSHSLFEEARGKCQKLGKLIRENERIKNKQELLNIVAEKIRDLKEDVRRVGHETASVQMSKREQALVKKLFAVPKKGGGDSAAMEGAIALLVFGQYHKALGEFKELINKNSLRVVAAKNIIRCHVGLSSLDDAVKQYEQWLSRGQFPPREIENIRSFLQDILKKKGVDKVLSKQKKTPALAVKIRPKPEDTEAVADKPRPESEDPALVADKPRPEPEDTTVVADKPQPEPEDTTVVADKPQPEPENTTVVADKPQPEPEDSTVVADKPQPEPEDTAAVRKEKPPEGEFIDILNIQLPINDEPCEDIRLDVGYQRGNLISVIVPKQSQVLVDKFKAGIKIDDVQFYSPSVVFRSSCAISDIKQIDSGPRKGEYALILEILSV
jgi:hypothetical protein